MNKWEPDNNPQQGRRIGKTLEELAELSNVLARISIQGLDAFDPSSGLTNRERMHRETADVLAQLECNMQFFNMSRREIGDRAYTKRAQMAEWEAHFKGSAK